MLLIFNIIRGEDIHSVMWETALYSLPEETVTQHQTMCSHTQRKSRLHSEGFLQAVTGRYHRVRHTRIVFMTAGSHVKDASEDRSYFLLLYHRLCIKHLSFSVWLWTDSQTNFKNVLWKVDNKTDVYWKTNIAQYFQTTDIYVNLTFFNIHFYVKWQSPNHLTVDRICWLLEGGWTGRNWSISRFS